jgi:phospholipid/cholesterol/gamma-HCH transport system ATP-binding protein
VIVENGREVVIRVRGLAKSFGSHQIWDGLNLDVFRGEILAIVGGSGQGKSVLMRVITGLVKPDAGDVGLFGQNTKTLSPQDRLDIERRWGILFQDGALFSSLTVLQNIQVPMREHLELPQAMMDDLAFLKLAMVGLPPNAAYKFPSELSGGMRKRAGLARALALDPEIVFLDEPTAGLDPVTARRIRQVIRDARDSGATIFLTTHDMVTADELCDRVAFLIDGRVAAIDAPRALRLAHGRRVVRVESRRDGDRSSHEFPLSGLADNADFLQLLRGGGIETMHTAETTLEDVFVTMTGRRLT